MCSERVLQPYYLFSLWINVYCIRIRIRIRIRKKTNKLEQFICNHVGQIT